MKKGQLITGNVLQMIPRLIITSIFMIIVIAVVAMFIMSKIDVRETENIIVLERMLYSPNGIAYIDSATQRVYPGIVDISKFTDERLDKSLSMTDNSAAAADLTLEYLDDTGATVKKEAYYNKVWYDRWLPLVATGLSGSGSATAYITNRYILVYDSGKLLEGKLGISILMPGKT